MITNGTQFLLFLFFCLVLLSAQNVLVSYSVFINEISIYFLHCSVLKRKGFLPRIRIKVYMIVLKIRTSNTVIQALKACITVSETGDLRGSFVMPE